MFPNLTVSDRKPERKGHKDGDLVAADRATDFSQGNHPNFRGDVCLFRHDTERRSSEQVISQPEVKEPRLERRLSPGSRAGEAPADPCFSRQRLIFKKIGT